ncbi:Hypothetical protein A7982_08851 [Minicystis rosea]|nr:Hypothetical protein A7982_08851 [Minicystis rosea]
MQAPALSLEDAFPPPSPRATGSDALPPVGVATLPSASAVPPIPAMETPPPPVPLPESWTSNLLARDAAFSLRREATRFGIGLGLAALYGLALGARQGRLAFVAHAAGVPAALLVAFGIGVPALYIFLALVDAPLDIAVMGAAATRATATAGLVLAGLAPSAALFVVTSERPGAAALAAGVGLAVGGAFGLGNVVCDLRRSIEKARATIRLAADVAFAGFGLFAIVIALRVWMSLLPVLGGAR